MQTLFMFEVRTFVIRGRMLLGLGVLFTSSLSCGMFNIVLYDSCKIPSVGEHNDRE